ncbi:hypothetical protein MPSEU_000486800 [Mayamaea pseudoterrestris]|nr:hypothetical protein MPSEU_000486800 [Mayamaea pseudoterrestris]
MTPHKFTADNQQRSNLTPTLMQALLHQECRYYSQLVTSEIASCTSTSTANAAESKVTWIPTPVARNKIGEWALRIMDHYNFPRECVSVALNYIDRMIISKPCTSCHDYQLLSVGSVFLAMKLSGNARVLPVSCMAHHIEGRFTKQQIIDMEYKILATLEWLVHPPTAIDFLYHYWKGLVVHANDFAAADHQDILDTATFLVEHSVVDSFFSAQKPSIIAMAALSLTIQVQLPSFLDVESFQLCRHRLHELAAQNTAAAEQQRTLSPISVTGVSTGPSLLSSNRGQPAAKDLARSVSTEDREGVDIDGTRTS